MPKKRLTALNGLTAQLRNFGAVMADPFRLKETVMLFVADRFGNSADASLLKVRDIDRLSWMVFRSTNPLRR